jgi:hypothetical protein
MMLPWHCSFTEVVQRLDLKHVVIYISEARLRVMKIEPYTVATLALTWSR